MGVPFYINLKDNFLVETIDDACSFFGLPMAGKPEISGVLDKNMTVCFADDEVSIIETPGHTPGGVCLILGNHIFVGDTIFRNSIGRTDLPGGNYSQLINSIKNTLFSLSPLLTIHPGHGPDTTVEYEMKNNPFLN